MNSPKAKLFLALRSRIPAEVPGIQFVTRDWAQLETPERPALPLQDGCALISFQGFNYKEEGELIQKVTGTVIIKLAKGVNSSESNITPDTAVEDALKIFDLEYDTNLALHGWEPGDEFGALIREQEDDDVRRPGVAVMVLRYKVTYTDSSTQRIKGRHAVNPGVSIEFKE